MQGPRARTLGPCTIWGEGDMSGYQSHMVGDRMYDRHESKEFMRAILVNENWIDDIHTTYLVNEIARIRGTNFNNGEAVLGFKILNVLCDVDAVQALHPDHLAELTAQLIGLFWEQM